MSSVFTFSRCPISVKSCSCKMYGNTISSFVACHISVHSDISDIYGFAIFIFPRLYISVQSHTSQISRLSVLGFSVSHISYYPNVVVDSVRRLSLSQSSGVLQHLHSCVAISLVFVFGRSQNPKIREFDFLNSWDFQGFTFSTFVVLPCYQVSDIRFAEIVPLPRRSFC